MIKYLAYSGISAAGSALASGVRGRRFKSAIPDIFCLFLFLFNFQFLIQFLLNIVQLCFGNFFYFMSDYTDFLSFKTVVKNKKTSRFREAFSRVTGLEPVISGVTGQRDNQLRYTRLRYSYIIKIKKKCQAFNCLFFKKNKTLNSVLTLISTSLNMKNETCQKHN